MICLVPGIILNHFSYRKSIFRYPKLKDLRNFTKTNIDLKIDFLIEKSISRFKKNGKNIEKHKKTRENSKIGRKRKFTEDSY